MHSSLQILIADGRFPDFGTQDQNAGKVSFSLQIPYQNIDATLLDSAINFYRGE